MTADPVYLNADVFFQRSSDLRQIVVQVPIAALL